MGIGIAGIASRYKVSYSRKFLWLLRLSGEAKRKEHYAKSNPGDFSLHIFSSISIHLSLETRQLAPSHLITLSARNSTDCGIVRLSAFAVLRLITNSNFVGCSTGRSAGLVPFKILSTYVAERRVKSRTLAERFKGPPPLKNFSLP